jgi:hypothetical protein
VSFEPRFNQGLYSDLHNGISGSSNEAPQPPHEGSDFCRLWQLFLSHLIEVIEYCPNGLLVSRSRTNLIGIFPYLVNKASDRDCCIKAPAPDAIFAAPLGLAMFPITTFPWTLI